MTTSAELLTLAKSHISHGWTRGYLARNAAAEPVDPNDTTAVCFCMLGAIDRADAQLKTTTGLPYSRSLRAIRESLPATFQHNIAAYNDYMYRTKEDVLAVYDRAIEKVKADL